MTQQTLTALLICYAWLFVPALMMILAGYLMERKS